MFHPLRRLQAWFISRLPRDGDSLRLDRRRIYILPTRQGYGFALVLFLMLLGSINYGASLGYMLTFLLAGLGLLAMLYTFRNLQHLEIRIEPAAPVFAGETARIPLILSSNGARSYYDLKIGVDDQEPIDLRRGLIGTHSYRLPSERRGRHPVGRILLETDFPLGLFRAWAWFQPDSQVMVYPAPAVDGLPLPPPAGGDHPSQDSLTGQDDLIGVRAYRPGDPPKRIAWKALAKGLALQTLEYQGDDQAELVLDWFALAQLDVESRLAQLCAWVLAAEAAGLRYGLRLPGGEIGLGSGVVHQRLCLEHLAVFEQP